MANKFTQSVLQKLEQEQKVQPKSKPQTRTITKKDSNPEQIIEKKIQTEKYESVAAETFPDISDYLRIEPVRSAKNKTFYLDVEVIDTLCAAARRQNVTDSKLCNDILRRVLGIGVKND